MSVRWPDRWVSFVNHDEGKHGRRYTGRLIDFDKGMNLAAVAVPGLTGFIDEAPVYGEGLMIVALSEIEQEVNHADN